MSFFRSFLIVAAFLLVYIPPASADVFVWQDSVTGVSLTFPDRWRVVHGQKPDDVMTIVAPGINDHAGCRMRVRDDRRFVVYPRRFGRNIQHVYFSRKFWEDYVGEYDDAVLTEARDDAGLGNGNAGYAEASFISTAGPKVRKRGIMLATSYNGKDYIFECSSEESVFQKWYRPFLSVLKSVNFRQEYHPYTDGYYRNFMADGPLHIHGKKPEDIYVY